VTLGGGAAARPATAASNTPSVHRVESKLQHGHAHFAMWYANPAHARASAEHFNRADGWTAELLLVPATGAAGTEYQVDGAQMSDGALPVFRFHGAAPFTLQCPDVSTPRVGQADVTFGLTNVSFDLLADALEGNADGTPYELQLYALVPVDTTELEIVVRFDRVACFRGTVEDGRLRFANACLPEERATDDVVRTAALARTAIAPADRASRSWGTIKALYR
jgi:hypothetical protein